jgi:TonB family protein
LNFLTFGMYKLIISFTIIFLLTSSGLDAQNNNATDSSGNEPIFEKVDIEATFPGGDKAWRKFLEQNLDANVPVENGAPVGIYTVVVQFIVDKQGNITDVKALTSLGYGLEKEVIQLIKKGPPWQPASQNGKMVKAYRKQPVTFVVMADGFDVRCNNDNILYTGINNLVTIKVDKVRNEDIKVSITGGSISYAGGNNYTVKVTSSGRAIIRIYNDKRGKKEIGAASFEIRSSAKSQGLPEKN